MRKPTVAIEPEEILPDAQHSEAGLPIAGLGVIEYAIRPRMLWIAWGLALASLAFLGITSARVVMGSSAKMAEENRLRTFAYRAPRGVVTDRYGTVLAGNRQRFALVVLPKFLPQPQEDFWRRLRQALGGSPDLFEHFAHIARASRDPFRLAFRPSLEQAVWLAQHEEDFPGLVVLEEDERFYPFSDEAFGHILGYVAQNDDILTGGDSREPAVAAREGRAGIELLYDQTLQGNTGMRVWEEDARGGARRVVELKEPEPGAQVMLTIDAELQRVSFEALSRMLKQIGKRRAALVALDPNSGEVLALVSMPEFSPNALSQGLSEEEFSRLRDDPDRPFFNRALSGMYAPGSTVKPFVAAAALHERLIHPDKTILVTGAISVPSAFNPNVVYTFPDWKAHGVVDMVRAIAVSSNVYFYTVGGGYGDQKGLGIERLKDYFHRFGLGVSTGIDLPGEASGLAPDPEWKRRQRGEDWYVGDTYHTAIGQGGMLATPLQIALATATLANGGTRYLPYMVKRVSGTGEDRKEGHATVVAAAVPRADTVVPRQGMRAAVLEGSSHLLNDLAVPVAGKTGTAQTGRGTSHAWFTSFAPFENPRIVLTLVFEEGGEGNAVAVPVAKEIYQWYIGNRIKK